MTWLKISLTFDADDDDHDYHFRRRIFYDIIFWLLILLFSENQDGNEKA